MPKPSLFPSPSFRWPDHSPYCPGRPGYKGLCDCGAETPSDVAKLRAERDELVAALEDCFPSLSCYCIPSRRPDAADARICCGCHAKQLVARIKGGG
jgi:hypothetical protein